MDTDITPEDAAGTPKPERITSGYAYPQSVWVAVGTVAVLSTVGWPVLHVVRSLFFGVEVVVVGSKGLVNGMVAQESLVVLTDPSVAQRVVAAAPYFILAVTMAAMWWSVGPAVILRRQAALYGAPRLFDTAEVTVSAGFVLAISTSLGSSFLLGKSLGTKVHLPELDVSAVILILVFLVTISAVQRNGMKLEKELEAIV